MPLDTFDSSSGIVLPDYAAPLSQNFVLETSLAEDRTRWTEVVDTNAVIAFQLAWTGLTTQEAQALFDFYNAHSGGAVSFLWKPPMLSFATEAYGFQGGLSWSMVGLDDYSLTAVLERRPLETA